MLNSISRLGETRPEQEWSNGTEFSGYSDFPEKRVHSKRIPKFSKTFPGIFIVPFSFGPEISVFLVEWKASMNIQKWEKDPVERLHTQFYKYFLGLNKGAPNVVARNETVLTNNA